MAVVVLMGMLALAGCASMDRSGAAAAPGLAASENPPTAGAGSGAPPGWPEQVPFPEGEPMDGYRCWDKYCRVWFGLMPFDQMAAFRNRYLELIRKSGEWEQLGVTEGPYENVAYRYTGATPSGCGYTWEMRHGIIPGDREQRFRVEVSLTW